MSCGRARRNTTKAGGTLQSFIPLGTGELTFNSIERANNRVAVFLAGKKASAQRDLLPRGSRKYYDAEKRAYYFRIMKGGIQPVLPSQVGDWEFFPTPDRD